MPTHRKRAPVMIPWLTIWRIAPSTPLRLSVKIPKRHEAHVADARVGDEAFDVGLGQRHVRAVDDGDGGERQHGRQEELCGIGKDRQSNPQQPVAAHLEENPARITLPAVGASVWASGSQVCTGNIGTLTAKPAETRRRATPAAEGSASFWRGPGKSSVPLA